MREIKFKGKRFDTGEWVYGYFFTDPSMTDRFFILSTLYYDENNPFESEFPRSIDCGGYEVIPESVGQYTGLKDKNGKEIYEGDIINWNGNLPMEVFYDQDCPGYYVSLNGVDERLFKRRMKWIEVIGNIYENSKLLEG